MRTEVLRSPERVFDLRDAWEALHHRTAAPISMSPTWLETWWTIFGGRFEIRVLAGWHDEHLVGLFPCFVEAFSFLHVRAKRMRFLGEYSILAEYHPLVDPEFEKEFAERAADFCLSALNEGVCDLVDFHAFPSTLPFMQRWIEAMRSRPVLMDVRDKEVPRIRIDLPGSPAEYWARLSGQVRQSLRKKLRIVNAAGARFECITDPTDTAAFEDYVRLNTRLFDQQGARSYFTTHEGFRQFQEDVTAAFLKRGQARLYFLEHEGRRFAALHAFVMNGVVQAYLGGRDPDHPLSRWSPGLLLMVHVITSAIEEGHAEFDFLTGDHEYKHQLQGSIHGWHGRVTATIRGLRGAKGTAMIGSHRVLVAIGRSPRLRRIEQLLNRLSLSMRGGERGKTGG